MEWNNRAEDPDCTEVRREMEALVRADGWDPEAIVAMVEGRLPQKRYLAQWAKALYPPVHPMQWGLPAQLQGRYGAISGGLSFFGGGNSCGGAAFVLLIYLSVQCLVSIRTGRRPRRQRGEGAVA